MFLPLPFCEEFRYAMALGLSLVVVFYISGKHFVKVS